MLIILFLTGILMWVIGSRLEKRELKQRDREVDEWLRRHGIPPR